MGHKVFKSLADSAKQVANGPAQLAAIGRKVAKTLIATTQHTLMFMGATTFVVVCVLLLKPSFLGKLASMYPFSHQSAEASANAQKVHISQLENWVETTATLELAPEEEPKVKKVDQQQKQLVASWISKRYRVALEATEMLVSAAYSTAKETKLDPLLILAVMAIESRFNPFAESPVGAQGLMQVMSKVHQDKFQDLGGLEAALDPVANIKVGSMILKEYVKRGGSVEQGLKSYVGAAAMENDSGYGAKVLAEYRKLKEVASGKKVPIGSTAKKPAPQRILVKDTNEQEMDDEDLPHEARNDRTDKAVSIQS